MYTILSLQKFQLHFAKLRPNRMPQVKRITCDTKEFAKYQKVLLKVYEKKDLLSEVAQSFRPHILQSAPFLYSLDTSMKWEKIISKGKFLFFKNMHLFGICISSKIAMLVQNPPPLHVCVTKGLWVQV